MAAAGFIGYRLTQADPDDARGAEGTATTGEPGGTTPKGTRLKAASITASCTGSPSEDAAGNTTTYDASLVADGNEATAWRCDTRGVGEELVLRFDRAVRITSVGLIPGIVKVDEADGTDRFEQNDRIARVRWIFDQGGQEQTFESTHDLQTTAVDVTTKTVTLEILDVYPGTDTPNSNGDTREATGKSPIAEVELLGGAT